MKKRMWKWLFFLLLTINLLVILSLGLKIFGEGEEIVKRENVELSEGASRFVVSTDKEAVNKLLDDYFSNDSVPLQLFLDNAVNVVGELPIFSATVPFQLIFQPEITKSGNVILKLTSTKLGNLNIPEKLVLHEVASRYPFPEWFKILPKQQAIYVEVTKIESDQFSMLRVKQFDLVKNEIQFEVYK